MYNQYAIYCAGSHLGIGNFTRQSLVFKQTGC